MKITLKGQLEEWMERWKKAWKGGRSGIEEEWGKKRNGLESKEMVYGVENIKVDGRAER